MSKRIKGQTNVTKKLIGRSNFLLVCMVMLFVLVSANLFRIQILNYEKYKAEATQVQLRETQLSAKRGTVYDSNMKVLAQSVTVWTIFVSPKELDVNFPEEQIAGLTKEQIREKSRELVADGLSQILEVDKDSILEKLKKTDSYYQVIRQKVDKPLADRVSRFCQENDIDGVNIAEDHKRYYPYGNFASTVLGFCGSDNQGLSGLESYYDEELTGTVGRVISAKNGLGYDMGTDYEVLAEAKDGYSLVTTIDETIQHYLENRLRTGIEENAVLNGACGIVMNVKTGAILALASYPNYDPNDPYTLVNTDLYNSITAIENPEEQNARMSEARQKQWRNKAVNDLYEPGSVFKIVTAAGALDSGAASLTSTYVCRGAVTVEDRVMRCAQTSGHGTETFAQALMNSCNPAFIAIGTAMGKDVFYDYFYSFGLAEKTGIDLPGETNSIYYTAETHTPVTLASSAFGQSNKITPIQMITAVATAVNGGNLVTPHVVEKLLDSDGNVVKDLTPAIRRQVISESVSKTICGILQDNVNTAAGHGKSAYVAGYRVGGKSGTSQKLDNANGSDSEYIASFVGFAPADDPEIAILIMLDTPTGQNGYYGGYTAGPIVGKLMGQVLPYLGVEPVYSAGEQATITVRSVTGESVSLATETLQRAGFTVKTVGGGSSVVSQFPAYGTKMSTGSTVILYTEQGETTMVPVPDLSGKSAQNARSALTSSGLNIEETGAYAGSGSVVVKSQSPRAGDKVPLGTTVTVTYVDNSTFE